jgi:hypothetical protein
METVADVTSSIPVAHFIPGRASFYRTGAGLFQLDVKMKGAMFNGLSSPTGNDSALATTCPTGNCTFTASSVNITYSSIGMCSACIDNTDFLTAHEKEEFNFNQTKIYNYTLPSGLALVRATDYIATSCALYPCLQNFHGCIKSGVLNETVQSTVLATLQVPSTLYPPDWNYTARKAPYLIDNLEYDYSNFSLVLRMPSRTFTTVNINGASYNVPEECLYKLGYFYSIAIYSFISTGLFNGVCTWNEDQGISLFCDESWWLSPLYNSGNSTFNTVSGQMDQFAKAMTNQFRTWGLDSYEAMLAEAAMGSAMQMTVCTSFDWKWLLMPMQAGQSIGSVI